MSSGYDHMKNRRTAANLIIEDTYAFAHTITPNAYAAALAHFGEDGDGELLPSAPTVYATCLTCYGEGHMRNPLWRDDEDNTESEAIECDQCSGGGFVQIKEQPAPVALDDDMPF